MHINIEECRILYYKPSKPPTCTRFGHTCAHPHGGVLLRKYYKNLKNQYSNVKY